MRHKSYPISLGLLLTLLVLWLQFTDTQAVQTARTRLESVIYDLRLQATLSPPKVDSRIVIVDIDEKSLHAEGHWPWRRDKLAHLVESLFNQGAAVVGFDMVFPEAEPNSADEVLQAVGKDKPTLLNALRELAPRFDHNASFARSLTKGDVVLGYSFDMARGNNAGVLPAPPPFKSNGDLAQLTVPTASGYTGNIGPLQRSAHHAGFFSLLPDPDGIIRRVPMLERYHGRLYPSLSLETARLFFLSDTIGIRTVQVNGATTVDSIVVGPTTIPTDGLGAAIVPYRGAPHSFPYVSATDVLHGKTDPDLIAGKVVLIGTTAQGLFDLRATPVAPVYPGVEVHANLIAGILDNHFPSEPSWARGANFTLTLLTGVVLALLLPYLSPLALLLVSFGVIASQVAFNFWIWAHEGFVLGLAPLLLLVLLLMALNMAYGFLFEARGRRLLKGMFGQYVPPALVEEMSRNPKAYGFEGESRELTVLFADIRNFTTISETLSASDLKAMLNRFFTPMTRIIFNNRGTIDKYVGDMIMAFWGAPVADPAHATHAIQAALEMLAEAERLKPEFKRLGLPEINIGIGLNSGLMNVGDMGSHYRRAYTVLGDAVNLGSRLEGTSKYYGVGLVVGESTWEQAQEQFLFRELDRVQVKGKAQAIRVFEPICRLDEADAALLTSLEQYHRALQAYRQQQWAEARERFQALAAQEPKRHIYRLYLERIEELEEEELDPQWDGVYVRTSK